MVEEHAVCPIGTYREWLEDSDFDTPTCAVCRGALADNTIRLLCHHLYHVACLDVHGAAQMEANTALACAVCAESIVPSGTASHDSLVVSRLLAHLSNAAWAAGINVSTSPLHEEATVLASPSRLPPPNYAYASSLTSRAPLSAAQILDEEEDKYRRRDGLERLSGAVHGSATGGDESKKKKVRTRFSLSKALFIGALLFAACSLGYIAMSLNDAS